MKKILYTAMLFAALSMASCGPGNGNKSGDAADSISDSEKALRDSIELAQKMPDYNQLEMFADTAKNKKVDNKTLAEELGMKLIRYDINMNDGQRTTEMFYGKYASVEKTSEGGYILHADADHAVVVRMSGSDKMTQTVYFANESDYKTFKDDLSSSQAEKWSFTDQRNKDSLFTATCNTK